MTETQNSKPLVFDLICYFRLSILGDINHYFIELGQGLRAFFSEKNANSNRNGIGVFFFAVNFLF